MSNYHNVDLTIEEQRELLDIKNKYLNLKNKHDNLKSLVEITKKERTRLVRKASIIFWFTFFALGTMISVEYPYFIDSLWFGLYLISGIVLYVVILLLCSREHDNYATKETEVYQQLCKAEKEYEKIKDKILEPPLPVTKQDNQDSLSVAKEKLRSYFKTSAALYKEPDATKLMSLLDKYPEFSNGKFYDVEFIDGGWRNVFKENLPHEIKKELRKILPEQLYDKLNYQSKK